MLAAATACAALIGVSPAHAASASCQISAHHTFSPGITPTSSAGAFTTRSSGIYGDLSSPLETGTISCSGGLTGSGTVGYESTYPSDDCLTGDGTTGTFTATIGGSPYFGSFSYTRVGVLVTANGTITGLGYTVAPFAGTFTATPDSGQNCFSTAVTGASLSGSVTIP